MGLHQKWKIKETVGVRAESAAGTVNCPMDFTLSESKDCLQGFKKSKREARSEKKKKSANYSFKNN